MAQKQQTEDSFSLKTLKKTTEIISVRTTSSYLQNEKQLARL